ncbi:MAG TPA: CDP-alcohol phosphatidyltransferase family protein [Vicinamibacterales bacterium]|nr:CDP-alcohol phosphatidyltransferase family protein [Vicinamibacterales bacterium]
MSTAVVRPSGSQKEFKDATRILTSVLAPIEKRTLIWLAERMPPRINSDHLTALALAAMIGAGLSFWLGAVTPIGLVLVVVCLAVNWFGDSLDGTLARVRQHQRPRYGFYVDHVIDAVGSIFLFGGMALSGFMSPAVAMVLLLAYFLLTIEVGLATHSLGEFRISYFKVGPTELRILLSIGALVLIVKPTSTIAGHEFLLFDVGGVIAIAGLIVTFVTSAIRNTITLYRAEPIPGTPRR